MLSLNHFAQGSDSSFASLPSLRIVEVELFRWSSFCGWFWTEMLLKHSSLLTLHSLSASWCCCATAATTTTATTAAAAAFTVSTVPPSPRCRCHHLNHKSTPPPSKASFHPGKKVFILMNAIHHWLNVKYGQIRRLSSDVPAVRFEGSSLGVHQPILSKMRQAMSSIVVVWWQNSLSKRQPSKTSGTASGQNHWKNLQQLNQERITQHWQNRWTLIKLLLLNLIRVHLWLRRRWSTITREWHSSDNTAVWRHQRREAASLEQNMHEPEKKLKF